MNHALSAVVMLLAGVLFTSCTATVVQQWATARQPPSEFVPSANPWSGRERTQALMPASTADQCKTDPSGTPQAGPAAPKFTPIRPGPKI